VCFAAAYESGSVQILDAGMTNLSTRCGGWRPKKRQGTKSREFGHRRSSGRYRDLMAAPNSRVDVTSTGCGQRICTLARLEACNRHLGKRGTD
jgi:hypothetical protein